MRQALLTSRHHQLNLHVSRLLSDNTSKVDCPYNDSQAHLQPESYEIPTPPVQVPGGFKTAHLNKRYDTSPPPVSISDGLEGVQSSHSYNLPSSRPSLDSSSTGKELLSVMPSSTMLPEQAQKEFEK